jgi:hypothetical protein
MERNKLTVIRRDRRPARAKTPAASPPKPHREPVPATIRIPKRLPDRMEYSVLASGWTVFLDDVREPAWKGAYRLCA